MDEQLDVVVVAKVSRPMREWLRHKAYIEERTMSSIIRDMLAQAQREERAEGGHDGRKVVGPAETETPPQGGAPVRDSVRFERTAGERAVRPANGGSPAARGTGEQR
jgi:hypothetical protein